MLVLEKLISFLEILAPLFLTIAVGFSATKFNIFPREGIKYLGLYVIKIAIPCLLFKALTERSIEETFQADYILVYTAGSLATLLLAIVFSRYLRHKDLTTSTVLAIGSSFSNSVYMGYPIIFQLLGAATIVPVALSLLVENAIMLPIALAIASSSTSNSSLSGSIVSSITNLFKNPMIWGIILGISSALLDLQLPASALSVITMFSNTSSPVALFTIGGALVGLKIKGMRLDVAQITFGKLIIHPLMMVVFLLATPDMPILLQHSAILLACMPMMSIYPIIGAQYNMPKPCAAALLTATLLSVLTICIWSLALDIL